MLGPLVKQKINMLMLEGVTIPLDEPIERYKEDVTKAFKKFMESDHVSLSSVKNVGILLFTYLQRVEELFENKENDEIIEWIIKCHDECFLKMKSLCFEDNDELVCSSFDTLLFLMPAQTVLYSKRFIFPIQQYAELIKIIMFSTKNLPFFISSLKKVLSFEDMSKNIWKALRIAVCDQTSKITANEVMSVLHIINCIEKPKAKENMEIGPSPSYCRTKEGVISNAEIEVSIKKIWNRISSIEDLSLKQKQMLLLVLYEQLMPRMKKATFLTDFFMISLSTGGPIGLLALQGMFTLIQKHNMNYPDVYKKIYSMLDNYVFDTHYKSRFYYLTDMFLSSLHLPEALVAGFIKKFARLSLVAPPTDIIIMMALIVNLIIRHPGLKVLLNKTMKIASISDDPYDINEMDPALSHAIDSSLWEIKIIQQHILPSVSSSAMFIENPLPSVELDLSGLLDISSDEIFGKEFKKKMKIPPISFEKPSRLMSSSSSGIKLWSFKK